jgi:hypothetical protein
VPHTSLATTHANQGIDVNAARRNDQVRMSCFAQNEHSRDFTRDGVYPAITRRHWHHGRISSVGFDSSCCRWVVGDRLPMAIHLVDIERGGICAKGRSQAILHHAHYIHHHQLFLDNFNRLIYLGDHGHPESKLCKHSLFSDPWPLLLPASHGERPSPWIRSAIPLHRPRLWNQIFHPPLDGL